MFKFNTAGCYFTKFCTTYYEDSDLLNKDKKIIGLRLCGGKKKEK